MIKLAPVPEVVINPSLVKDAGTVSVFSSISKVTFELTVKVPPVSRAKPSTAVMLAFVLAKVRL